MEPMRPAVWIYRDAAELFETDPRTISGLVKAFNLTPKPTGMPGKARGLDRADMRVIAKALGKSFRLAVPA